ncbi:MAG: DoxX family protein [Leptospiraceae bacterium]
MQDILLLVLGVFFILNGLNHLINTHVYKKYAAKRGLIHPAFMVRISAIVLLMGGISLATRQWMQWGIAGLAVFLVLASVLVHRFWEEPDRDSRLSEGMHLAKNILILTELAYIYSSL